MSSVSIVELREVSGSLKDDLSYIREFLTTAREDFDGVKSKYNDIMSYQDKELEGERVVKKRDETSSGGEVIHKEITKKTYVHFSPGTDFNSYFNRLNSYCVAAERDLKKLEQQVQKIDESANDIESHEKEIVAALMAIESSGTSSSSSSSSSDGSINSIGALKEDDYNKQKENEEKKKKEEEEKIDSIGALKEDDYNKQKEYEEKKKKETKEDVSSDTGSDGSSGDGNDNDNDNDNGSSSGHDSSSRSGGSSGKSSKSHESSKKESVGLKFISNTQKDINNKNTVEGVAISDLKKSYSEINDDENPKIVSDIPDNEKFVTETEEFEKLANKALESVKNDLSQNKNIDTTTSTSSSDSQINSSNISVPSNSESVPVITQTSDVSESPSNNAVDMMEDIYSAPVYESIPNTGIGDKEISTNYSIPVIAGVIGGAGIGLGLREKMKDDEEKKKSTIEENNN